MVQKHPFLQLLNLGTLHSRHWCSNGSISLTAWDKLCYVPSYAFQFFVIADVEDQA